MHERFKTITPFRPTQMRTDRKPATPTRSSPIDKSPHLPARKESCANSTAKSQPHVSGRGPERQRTHGGGAAEVSAGDSGAFGGILLPTTTEETEASVNASGDECQHKRRRRPPRPLLPASISAPSGVSCSLRILTRAANLANMIVRYRHQQTSCSSA